MRTTLKMGGITYKVKRPRNGSSWAEVPGVKCPSCGMSLIVGGKGKHIASFSTYEAAAICARSTCFAPVGTLVTKVSTIFGLEEDERVLNSCHKIY